jgi:hypothetical protein
MRKVMTIAFVLLSVGVSAQVKDYSDSVKKYRVLADYYTQAVNKTNSSGEKKNIFYRAEFYRSKLIEFLERQSAYEMSKKKKNN